MAEQSKLLAGMLAQAELSVKQVGERAAELEARLDMLALEGLILEAVLRLGAIWLGMILTHWAENLATKTGTRLPCACGGVARWVAWRAKTVLALLGRTTYWRVYFHCERCGHGEGLGDRQWSLHKTRTSLGVKQLLGYLSGTTVGFANVASSVCRTLRWPQNWLSGKQVQRLAEPIGKLLAEQETRQVARWWAMVCAGLAGLMEAERPPASEQGALHGGQEQARPDSGRLYLQMDGIMGRLRGVTGAGSDLWREVKVGTVFWAEAGRHASSLAELVGKVSRTQHSVEAMARESRRVWVDRPQGAITYVAGLLPATQFGIRLYAEAVARGLEQAGEVVVLGDGAHWIWQLAEEHFPGATQILDFQHAREWVRKVGQAVWGEGSAKAEEWAERQIVDHLIEGDAEGLVRAIAVLPKTAPPAGESKSIPEQGMEYFGHNAGRMRYPQYRARGLEIGSGVVESAGRRVVGVRCKQPGMRWSEEGLSAVIDLRTHALNHRYDVALANLMKAA